MKTHGYLRKTSGIPRKYSQSIKREQSYSRNPTTDLPDMSSNYSRRTTPHSDVDHPHRITYSPFNEEEDPQPIPILYPRPPTPGPIALENKGTQTSPKPCPIHQQHVAIITTHIPPFARQIQNPPTLQEALELRELLRNPDLQIPITTHCELHSLMFTLHRTYRNPITDEDHHPNEKQRKTLEANIIESLHQIDALPFLRDLKQIPERHRRRTFCTNCYQLGHWKKDCCFYQCPHCHLHQPHHEEHLCLLKSLGPYSRPKTPVKEESQSPPPLPVKIPYQRGFKTRKPASPLTSPTTSSSSNGKINKNKGKGKKKNYYTREQRKAEKEIDRAFDDIEREWDRRIQEFSQQHNEPYDYDDKALDNINGEPSGF